MLKSTARQGRQPRLYEGVVCRCLHRVGEPDAAPILMTIVRLVQGLSVGGELVGSLIYSCESSGRRARVLLAALPMASAGAGLALGYLVAGILSAVLTESQQWLFGWRIGFALGSPIAVLAVVARSRLSESEAFREAQ